MTRAADLLEIAKANNATIAAAESCTGGLIAGAITEIPGSSDVFDRGFVTYSNAAKTEMFGIPPDFIERFGAVSEEVARAMADGALQHSHATLAVAVTGIAGPGGSNHKPEGRVCFAVAFAGQSTRSETVDFGALGRSEVRAATVRHALSMLIDALTSARGIA